MVALLVRGRAVEHAPLGLQVHIPAPAGSVLVLYEFTWQDGVQATTAPVLDLDGSSCAGLPRKHNNIVLACWHNQEEERTVVTHHVIVLLIMPPGESVALHRFRA